MASSGWCLERLFSLHLIPRLHGAQLSSRSKVCHTALTAHDPTLTQPRVTPPRSDTRRDANRPNHRSACTEVICAQTFIKRLKPEPSMPVAPTRLHRASEQKAIFLPPVPEVRPDLQHCKDKDRAKLSEPCDGEIASILPPFPCFPSSPPTFLWVGGRVKLCSPSWP